jgi:hypothetical protein
MPGAEKGPSFLAEQFMKDSPHGVELFTIWSKSIEV